MSTTTAAPIPIVAAVPEVTRTRASFRRLVEVELRKVVDTRAGAWLLLAVAALNVVVPVSIVAVGDTADRTLAVVLEGALLPGLLLLPVLGILLVTSEWSQRTALVTFALVPDRGRLLLAKVGAGTVLSLACAALAAVVAIACVAVAGDTGPDPWSLSVGLAGQMAFAMVVGMLIGIAFGVAVLASAPAIVGYFALPFALNGIASISALRDVGAWLDQGRTLPPLTSELLDVTQWGHVATTLVLWLVVPAAIGLRRVLRAEIG